MLSKPWHRAKRDEVEAEVWAAVDLLMPRVDGRRDLLRMYRDLYAGRVNGSVPLVIPGVTDKIKTLSFNLTQSITDTLVSRLVTQKPRPRFLTSGAGYEDRARGKLLEQFVDGVIDHTGAYSQMARMAKDAVVCADGFVKVSPSDGEIAVERVPPEAIVVDEYAARHYGPRSMYQLESVSAHLLAELYPKHRGAIYEQAGSARDRSRYDVAGADMTITDEVDVVEAWHLPSTKTSKDGRHVIAIRGATLLDEEWDSPTFPFVHLQYTDCLEGFYGQGVAERRLHLQVEVNKIAQRIQEAMHYHAKADIYIEEGSIDEKHLKNSSGNIVKYKPGTQPPVARAQGSMPSEVFRYLDDLIRKGFEFEGTSQMSAQSKKPAGVESGVALMNLHDFETLRHGDMVDRYQQAFKRLAEEIVRCAAKLYEGSTDYAVHYRAKDFVQRIKWSDVDIDRDKYVITVYPANLLPQTPSGRLETVQQLLAAGFIDRTEARQLIDMPDVQNQLALSNAMIEDIDAQAEAMILRGEYQAPEDKQGDLAFAIERMTAHLIRARRLGAPADKLDLLRQWIDDAELILRDAMSAAQPPPPMAAPGMPPALPGVMPPS